MSHNITHNMRKIAVTFAQNGPKWPKMGIFGGFLDLTRLVGGVMRSNLFLLAYNTFLGWYWLVIVTISNDITSNIVGTSLKSRFGTSPKWPKMPFLADLCHMTRLVDQVIGSYLVVIYVTLVRTIYECVWDNITHNITSNTVGTSSGEHSRPSLRSGRSLHDFAPSALQSKMAFFFSFFLFFFFFFFFFLGTSQPYLEWYYAWYYPKHIHIWSVQA